MTAQRTAGGKIARPTITDKMKLAVLRRHSVIVGCAACLQGVPLKLVAFDHTQALVDGGEHSVDNLRPICPDCHKPKSAFEHKRNSKSKRIAKAREVHEAVLRGDFKRPPGKIKSAGFRKDLTRGFDGKVRKRT